MLLQPFFSICFNDRLSTGEKGTFGGGLKDALVSGQRDTARAKTSYLYEISFEMFLKFPACELYTRHVHVRVVRMKQAAL